MLPATLLGFLVESGLFRHQSNKATPAHPFCERALKRRPDPMCGRPLFFSSPSPGAHPLLQHVRGHYNARASTVLTRGSSVTSSIGASGTAATWFDNNLSKVGCVQDERQRNAAVGVLRRQFNNNTGDFLQFAVCSACKEALTSGKVPVMSVSNGYRYPPKPEHLPALNPVEERIIARRLPFMSIRRPTHGNGQYGINGASRERSDRSAGTRAMPTQERSRRRGDRRTHQTKTRKQGFV
ncbi:hypothetical protein HPB49_016300 [Dermacentor silvarum]|uniref:Uncharacterized protein n=1 Tax=Dermacentor silvarum TaxID=543639 RepID=A0ACB8C4I2_DERSI|nr:hypothetical protein HPB49_016300 [Dermacentor silvarum]